MAAPPLGTTTRILLALTMTILGFIVGFIVARGVAKPRGDADMRRRRAAITPDEIGSPVAFFGATQDEAVDADGDEGIEEEDAFPRRKRQFAIMPEEVVKPAPAPGPSEILNVADLELESFDAPDDEAPFWRRASEPVASADRLFDISPNKGLSPRGASLFATDAQKVSREGEAVPAPGFDLLPRFGSRNEAGADKVMSPVEAVAPAPAAPPLPRTQTNAQAPAAERLAKAPLDTLSPVELLERLALSIERRRQIAAERAAQAEASQVDTSPNAPDAPAPFSPPSLDLDEGAEETLSVSVPPPRMGLAATPPVEGEEDVVLAEGYSSLRGLTKPAARPPFLRFDALGGEPATTVERPASQSEPEETSEPQEPRAFDGQQRGTQATDAALRAALATLQRMSGAA